MNDETKFEQVAKYLDGQCIKLSDDELALVREIQANRLQLGAVLDESSYPPPGVVERVKAKTLARLVELRKKRLVINISSLAAAAVLVLALALWPMFKTSVGVPPVQSNGAGEFSAWASEIDPNPSDMICLMSDISGSRDSEQEEKAETFLELDFEM